MPLNVLIRAPAPTSPGRSSGPVRQRGLLAVMCACVVLVVGMVAAVNLVVPMLAASALHPSAPALVWIVDTYVIVFACLVIPGGAAGDRFGRKASCWPAWRCSRRAR
jgi:MFS family permease